MGDLDFPWAAYLAAQQQKNQNQQQMNQNIAGIGQGLGQGMTAIGDQMKKEKQIADWQKTINEAMMNPQTTPQVRQMLPLIGQIGRANPAVAGEMMASISKPGNQNIYIPVPGVLSDTGTPLVISKRTGKIEDSGVKAVPTGKGYGQDLSNIDWDKMTSQEQSLAKQLYDGNIRPYDLGYRERSKAVVGANEYARKMNLQPYQSFRGDVNSGFAKNAATGKLGMNALALNTALGHVSSANDAYQALGNTDSALLNKPINVIRKGTKDRNIIALGLSLNALRGELSNVFKSGGGTDQEIKSWREFLNEDLTPDQYMAAIPQIDELLRSRIKAMDYQQQDVTQRLPSQRTFLSPHGAALSKKFEAAKTPQATSGLTPAEQAEFDRLHKKFGGKP